MYYEINKYYPAYPNLPYRCEVKGLHYWLESEAMIAFNTFCFALKRKSKVYEWIDGNIFLCDGITYKLEPKK